MWRSKLCRGIISVKGRPLSGNSTRIVGEGEKKEEREKGKEEASVDAQAERRARRASRMSKTRS
jgi:hypothetical protein